MVRNLRGDDKDPGGPRRQLDESLQVAEWSVPGHLKTFRQRMRERNPGAPSWWYGDEEASQSFMSSMGAG